MDQRWKHAVDAFLAEMFSLSGSVATRYSYGRVLRRFLARHPDPAAVTDMDVSAFVYAPCERSKQAPLAATIHSRVNPLRGFYRRAVLWGLVERSPAESIRRPRLQPGLPRGLSATQLVALLRAIPTCLHGTRLADQREARDRALILTSCFTGLRTSEVLSIRAGALTGSWESNAGGLFAQVRCKGGKVRRIHLPPPVVAAIRFWFARWGRSPRDLEPDETIWGGVTKSTYAILVSRYGRAAGLGHVTPHGLRHSHAQLLRRLGAEIEDVQHALGHDRATTTDTYLRRLAPERNDWWPGIAEALGIEGPPEPRPAKAHGSMRTYESGVK